VSTPIRLARIRPALHTRGHFAFSLGTSQGGLLWFSRKRPGMSGSSLHCIRRPPCWLRIALRNWAVCMLLGAAAVLPAAEQGDRQVVSMLPHPSIPMPTLGGKQFWADELFFHQWRIQRNTLTGHYRLLDENNLRHASGTAEQCRAKLDEIRQQRHLPPMHGEVVIVLHGLGRSRSSMESLCKYLRERGGYTVLNVSYASTQADIAEHARSLGRLIESLDGVEEISFVAHSLGNIVIRRYLGDHATLEDTTDDAQAVVRAHWQSPSRPAQQAVRQAGVIMAGNLEPQPEVSEGATTGDRHGIDRRLKRFVMITPPNHGSLVALQAAAELGPLSSLAGPPVQELGRQWETLESRLATPQFEFGIIAGGRGTASGWNPVLPGDNDGTISVSTTKLTGAADFVVVPITHTAAIENETVLQCTLRFLKHGYFRASGRRQPLGGD
jgi:pimeloyl-ACP methyl ester carboxylesterase